MQAIRNVFLGIDCFQSNVFLGSVCQVSDLVTVGQLVELSPWRWRWRGGAGRGFVATTGHLAPPLSTSAADQKYKYSACWFLHRLEGTHPRWSTNRPGSSGGLQGGLHCHNLPLPINDWLTAGLVRPCKKGNTSSHYCHQPTNAFIFSKTGRRKWLSPGQNQWRAWMNFEYLVPVCLSAPNRWGRRALFMQEGRRTQVRPIKGRTNNESQVELIGQKKGRETGIGSWYREHNGRQDIKIKKRNRKTTDHDTLM